MTFSWKAPRHGWPRINTDGASSGNNLSAGCRGVIGMIEVVGCGVCQASRLYVCLRGRAMEGLRGFRFGQSDRPSAMELELVVIRSLQGGSLGSIQGRTLPMKIRRLLEADWRVCINHIYREKIMLAGGLACLGYEFGEDLVIFEHPPKIKQ